jgi:multiple sugar transport system substrate-binding protein
MSAMLGLSMLAGCQKSAGDRAGGATGNEKMGAPTETQASTEPVTLSFYSMPAFNKEKIQTQIVEPVRKKFPNITLNVLDNSEIKQDIAFDKMVTANTIPDFMLINFNTVRILKSMGIATDLTPMIKSNKVDTQKFMPRAIEYMQQYGEHNELYALPYFINVNVLSYNKDLFDKFGVAYPRDGMTWDETIDLAKKMTRNADGVDYLGLNPSRPYVIAPQVSQDVVDSKTGKATVNNDGWKQVFQLLQNVYSIQGNVPDKVNDFWGAKNSFYKNQNLAMTLLWWDQTIGGLQESVDSNKGVNWDMVTAPVFSTNPKMGQWLDQFDMAVAAQSKHQKEAFQVIDYLTSNEYQTGLSQNGYITPLNDQAIKAQLGAGLPILKGKNVQALFKLDYAKPLTPTKINVNAIFDPFYKGVVYDKKDINTTLRELEDKLNQAIEENQ